MAEIEFQTPHMRVVANPDLGAEITHLGGGDGANLLYMGQWKTPLRASESYSYGSQLLDWLSEYRGGWQELFPNAGGAGDVLGCSGSFSRRGLTRPLAVALGHPGHTCDHVVSRTHPAGPGARDAP